MSGAVRNKEARRVPSPVPPGALKDIAAAGDRIKSEVFKWPADRRRATHPSVQPAGMHRR